MKKIELNLNDDDFAEIIDFVLQSGSETLKTEFEKAVGLLNDNDHILQEVCKALADLSGKPLSDIQDMAASADHQDLTADVKLTALQIDQLKGYFQDIVDALHYSGTITGGECSNLSTINDCVKLIAGKK
ncbi:MAG: hypothetical protein JWP44_2117 [Mucilaginibacter sp.]|nr:hypothetical protein [Mucilaginibacter sp.]